MTTAPLTNSKFDRPAGSNGERSQISLDLPCVSCGYNLRGLSPLGACPECGVEARATLLFVVDPARSEIEPLDNPARLGRALVGASSLVLLAAIVRWLPHAGRAIAEFIERPFLGANVWTWLSLAVSGVMGLAAIAFLRLLRRPTGSPADPAYRRSLRVARLGLGLWSLLAFVQASYDLSWGPGAISGDIADIDVIRSALRLAMSLCLILAMIGARPVIRFIGLRSLSIRIGRISRQGFGAMIVAAAVIAIGDVGQIILAGVVAAGRPTAPLESWAFVSHLMILLGSGMLTLALVNLFVDAIHLARDLRRPTYELAGVVELKPGQSSDSSPQR